MGSRPVLHTWPPRRYPVVSVFIDTSTSRYAPRRQEQMTIRFHEDVEDKAELLELLEVARQFIERQ